MIKLISVLLLSVFLIPLIQFAHGQAPGNAGGSMDTGQAGQSGKQVNLDKHQTSQ